MMINNLNKLLIMLEEIIVLLFQVNLDVLMELSLDTLPNKPDILFSLVVHVLKVSESLLIISFLKLTLIELIIYVSLIMLFLTVKNILLMN